MHLPCRSLKDQSGFSDIQIINAATPATSNILKEEDHWPSIGFSSARKDCSQVVHVVYRTHLHRLYNTEQICIP